MPGFNQRGPMNEGPKTGGARGICNRRNQAGYGAEGFNGGMGRGRGRGLCRRAYPDAGFGRGAAPAQDPLEERVKMLEAELADARARLNDQP